MGKEMTTKPTPPSNHRYIYARFADGTHGESFYSPWADRYWASEGVALLRKGDAEATIDALRIAGYPQNATCVLCGVEIAGGLDWWSLGGVSGPCCGMRSGCRQKGQS